MHPYPSVTVIIAVYNKINYLRLVLAGFQRQSHTDFEVVLADDGSNPASVAEINELSETMPFTVRHLWHPDAGFRKNIIMNRAITEAAGDYLIFIDGDCIPHKRFVEEHVRNAALRQVLNGRRVNLPEAVTKLLTPKNVQNGYAERQLLRTLITGWGEIDIFPEHGIYVPSAGIQRLINRKDKGLLGSNFSLYKTDMLAINGFDERYVLPSVGEDTDIEYRLRLLGMQFKTVKNVAVQYHLWHRLLDRPQQNMDLYSLVQQEGKAFTDYGIVKLER